MQQTHDVRVVDPAISPDQVRRFQELTQRVQACGLLLPPHRYVVALDPPHIEMPTEPVSGQSLPMALAQGEVRQSEVCEALLALLRLGRDVFRTGGDLLSDLSLDRFVYGATSAGAGVYFVDLEPAFATWDRDFSSASRGLVYGQLVAAAADLLQEVEAISGWTLSACRLAALAICAEIEVADPDQPWTDLLRNAIIEDRPSTWRSWY